MEARVCIPPLDLMIQIGDVVGTRLRNLRGWSYLYPQQGYSCILTRLQKSGPIFNMRVDFMKPVYNLEPKYRVTMLAGEEWTRSPEIPVVKGLLWCTDGSRTANGTWPGVYGQSINRRLSIPLGIYARSFRLRYMTILACAYDIEAQDRSEI
jgi:hypothetical protein